MATSKLKYSGFGSTQNKSKFIQENNYLLPSYTYSGHTIQSNHSPPFSLEHQSRLKKDSFLKGKYTYNLFDDPSLIEKTNNAKSLFGRIKDEPIRYEAKPNKGHQRVKSSITETYQRNLEKQEEDLRSKAGSTLGRYQGSLRRPSYGPEGNYANGAHEDPIGRLLDDYRATKDPGRESRNTKEDKILNGMGTLKEGRTLGEFLTRDGGFGKSTMSPEDTRHRRKEASLNNEFGGESLEKKSALKSSVGRSPNQNTLEEMTTPKGEFTANLDTYIDYFKKTDRSHKKQPKGGYEYTGEDRGKSRDEDKEGEIRFLRNFIEELNNKVNQVTKVNTTLVKEFKSMLSREQESTQRIGKLEEEFHIMKDKNKKYREKLRLTTQLLEKERVDNQHNLIALKKVLSDGINMALENKVKRNLEAFQGKYQRDDNNPRNTPTDLNAREERREGSHGRKSSEKKPSQKREESVFAQQQAYSEEDSVYVETKTEKDEVIGDTEEEKQDTSEPIDEDTDNQTSENRDVQSKYKKGLVWSPQQRAQKEAIRDQQIRALQEKIAEMMQSQQDDASTHQTLQERYPNRPIPQHKPKYHKHSYEANVGNYDYMPVAKERQNHLKVQGYLPRY